MPGRGRGLKNIQKQSISVMVVGNAIGSSCPSVHVPETNTNAGRGQGQKNVQKKGNVGNIMVNSSGFATPNAHVPESNTNAGRGRGQKNMQKERNMENAMENSGGSATPNAQLLGKNLRNRVVTNPSPRPTKPVQASGNISQTPDQRGQKNLRSRVLVFEAPQSPSAVNPRNTGNASKKMTSPNKTPVRSAQDKGTTTVEKVPNNSSRGTNALQEMSNSLIGSTNQSNVEQEDVLHEETTNIIIASINHNALHQNKGNNQDGTENEREDDNHESENDGEYANHEFENYGAQQNARKRGPNRNVRLEREVRAKHREDPTNTETYKPTVEMPPTENKPVGEWSSTFSRELGCLIRQFAPIQVESWIHISHEKKEQLCHLAKKKFNIVGDDQHVKDNIMESMQKLYGDWRSKSHIWYKHHGGPEGGKQNPPAAFKGRVHDWEWLCDNIFENDEWKEISNKNRENRTKLGYVNRGGSKSYAQKRHEMTTKKKRKPNALELFIATHTNKDGQLDEGAKKVVEKMKVKLASAEAEGSTADDDIDDILSGCVSKKSLVASCGKRARGRSNSYGEGTSGMQLTDDIQAIIDTKNSELEAQLSAKIDAELSKNQEYENKLKAAEAQIESQTVVIKEQEGSILSLQKDMTEMKADINSIYRLLLQKQVYGSGPSN